MRTHVVDHPLVAHKLTALRDEDTDSPTFRRLADELVTLLAYEATRDVRIEPVDITTPVAPTTGVSSRRPSRSSCRSCAPASGMLDGMVRLLPTAEVGFLGMIRDEDTLQASTYAERLPDDLSGRQCYVLDPMLATGGTLAAAIKFLSTAAPTTSPRSACWPRPRAARGWRRTSPASTSRSPSSPPRWTRSSTRRATSSPASVTRATASTASSAAQPSTGWSAREDRHLPVATVVRRAPADQESRSPLVRRSRVLVLWSSDSSDSWRVVAVPSGTARRASP